METFDLIKLATLCKSFECNCKYRLTILNMNLQSVLLLGETHISSEADSLISTFRSALRPVSPWFRHSLSGLCFPDAHLPSSWLMHHHALQTTHHTMCIISGFLKGQNLTKLISDSDTLKTTSPPNSERHCYCIKLNFSTVFNVPALTVNSF